MTTLRTEQPSTRNLGVLAARVDIDAVVSPTGAGTSSSASSTPVGYYVHHHGVGHLTRFRAIRAAANFPIHAVSELAAAAAATTSGCQLPADVDANVTSAEHPEHRDPTAGGTLHWAPLDAATAAPRLAMLARWLDDTRPTGVVVDVSVEVALTCRLAGTATVVVRQHGRRNDAPHVLAYRQASRLLAPWPRELEDPRTPAWVVAKTDYVGFVCDTDDPDAVDEPSGGAVGRNRPGPDDVVVLWGSGGGTFDDDAIVSLAAATKGVVHLVGACFADGAPPIGDGVVVHGWVDRPQRLLRERPTVVASAGNNTVAAAARHGCALVVVPQPRPFDEQHAHARRLDEVGAAAMVDDPTTQHWRRALAVADQRAHMLAALAQPLGAERAAAAIGRAFDRDRA